MNSTRNNLYFIAVSIPAPSSEELTNYKWDIAKKYNSREALRVFPHFTLKAPFMLPTAWHKRLVEWFQEMSIIVSSFQQELSGFSAFYNKNYPVIYAKPINTSMLKQLQKQVISHFQKNRLKEFLHPFDISYTPHATIAYRDLSVRAFHQAWQEYKTKDYQATFNINSFHLLQHDRKKWQSISEYTLPVNNTVFTESPLSKQKALRPKVTALTLFNSLF